MAVEEVEFRMGGGADKPARAPTVEVEGEALDTQDPEIEVEGEEPEIEVVDDTPEPDRGKKPAPPPDEVTEDELVNYSEKVKKRLKHLGKGYHDERRRAEAAERERDAAIQAAKSFFDKVKTLEGGENKSKQMVLEQAKRAAELEHAAAERAYQDAYEAGDAAAVTKAQSRLTDASIRLDKVKNYKLPPLQTEKPVVQQPQRDPESQPLTPQADPKATRWREDNSWFGSDHEMTAFAIGYHRKLVESGVDPRSDDYYEKLNARMRQVFPDQYDDDLTDDDFKPPAGKKPPPAVVASASRSVAPKKITLTKSEADMARKLGVPLKEYALEVAKLRNKDNG